MRETRRRSVHHLAPVRRPAGGRAGGPVARPRNALTRQRTARRVGERPEASGVALDDKARDDRERDDSEGQEASAVGGPDDRERPRASGFGGLGDAVAAL